MNEIVQYRILNGWPLFFLIAALSAVVVGISYAGVGVATPEATVHMIRRSVQVSAPWIFITFAVSSLVLLWPGTFTRWMLRNRRYLGLSFAGGMAWQLVFIYVLFAEHAWYYWEVLHKPEDLFLRVASYGVLIAMVVTSFYPVRRRMQRWQWDWLQLLGVWYMWLAIWVSYAGIVFSPDSPGLTGIAIVYTIAGFIALLVRLAAWWQKRRAQSLKVSKLV